MNKTLCVNRDGLTLFDRYKLKEYPEITDTEAYMMLHALGADNKPYRKYRGSKYYHAYRNYYDAGGEDVEVWNGLVKKELADHTSHAYHVTVKGIRLLEFMTQCRIYDARANIADCRTAVLKRMIEHDVFCGYGCWLPISATTVALSLAIPVNLARKTLRKLAEEGWVRKDYEGGIDDEGFPHCVHGWNCTQKVKSLEIYREYQNAEYARINKMLQMPLSEQC